MVCAFLVSERLNFVIQFLFHFTGAGYWRKQDESEPSSLRHIYVPSLYGYYKTEKNKYVPSWPWDRAQNTILNEPIFKILNKF